MNIKQIITAHLAGQGFDGLWHGEGDGCACRLGDLMPCSGGGTESLIPECQPGYLAPCLDGCDFGGGACEFHITRDRPEREAGAGR